MLNCQRYNSCLCRERCVVLVKILLFKPGSIRATDKRTIYHYEVCFLFSLNFFDIKISISNIKPNNNDPVGFIDKNINEIIINEKCHHIKLQKRK